MATEAENWRMAVMAFDAFQTGVYPSPDEAECERLEPLVEFLKARYDRDRRRLGFQEAAWQAKIELLMRLAHGLPITPQIGAQRVQEGDRAVS